MRCRCCHVLFSWLSRLLDSCAAHRQHNSLATSHSCLCQSQYFIGLFLNLLQVERWRGGATGRVLDLWPTGRGFKSYSGQSCVTTWTNCSHLCASATKQYNLVPAKGRCSAAKEVTAGLAESNDSLPLVRWLIVTCRLTACTTGSAPGPMLGNEYGKALPLLRVE